MNADIELKIIRALQSIKFKKKKDFTLDFQKLYDEVKAHRDLISLNDFASYLDDMVNEKMITVFDGCYGLGQSETWNKALLAVSKKRLRDYPKTCPERKKILAYIKKKKEQCGK